jgi:hypothetical protein
MFNRSNFISPLKSSLSAGLLRAMACLFVLAMASPVQAATFVMVSPNVLAITGHIGPGDCDRWKAAALSNVDTVLLHSGGGSVKQGQCISHAIAERHLKTLVPLRCSSICFLMFAAGTERWTCDGVRIGVHRPHNTETGEEMDPSHTEKIMRWAAGYGVPQPILQKLAETPAKSIYVLTKEELATMHARDAKNTCTVWAGVARSVNATTAQQSVNATTAQK